MSYRLEDLFGIQGRTAVITGATGGIGSEIARAFCELGANVVLVDLDRARLDEMEASFSDRGFAVMTVAADVTDHVRVAAMTESVIKAFGAIDILINCAGMVIIEPSHTFDPSNWSAVMDVNVKGTMLMCQSVGAHMLRRKQGRIVNFSSVRGLQGKEGYLGYATSKGAVNLLTKTLAVEWAPHNVHVNAVAPIFTLTEMNKKILDDQKTYDWVLSRLPKGRLCEKSDLIGPVLFLCSNASSFVTGEVLYVDGGWTAG